MLELTDAATGKLEEYLNQNNITSAIRIAAMNGCGGLTLGLALDEKKENDAAVEQGGLSLIIDNELLQALEEVKVDFVEPEDSGCGCSGGGGGGGFAVTSKNPLPNSGGGCGNSCASDCGC